MPPDVIRDILDCGHLAPSALNKQPWLLGAVTDSVLLKGLADLVEDARFIQQSTVCFSVFTKAEEDFRLEDGCAAAMNIIYACEAHGVGSCWVAGDRQDFVEQVRELLNVPKGYDLIALIPAGYPDQAPISRKKQLDDVTFINSYTGKENVASVPGKPARASLKARLRHFIRGLLLKWF